MLDFLKCVGNELSLWIDNYIGFKIRVLVILRIYLEMLKDWNLKYLIYKRINNRNLRK